MLKVKLHVDDDIQEMTRKVLDSFRIHLTSVLKRAAQAVQRRCGEICDDMISNTEEYKQLLGGELLGELGVPNIEARLRNILTTIKSSVEVDATPVIVRGDVLECGLIVKMVRSDFMDILGLPDAEYNTEKGTNIPWLDWLLTQGDRIIVIGYDVEIARTAKQKAVSRTGLALMKRGSGWRVPPEFSGTLEDNFITRAFNVSELERLFLKIMEEEIVSRI